MSNKSGTSSQVISLPKGGGALQGIGEKFSPDLFTGTGNFTVPIALPPGRNGFQPQLNLVYSTGNGNGPFGLGWSLSVPGVSRKTSHGVPCYRDGASAMAEPDTFILSGAEDLVPVEDSTTQTRYRPRTEGLFARIVHHHNAASNDNYWEVQSKDGLISLYGTRQSAGNDPAVAANPDPLKRTQIFAWKLTETRDPFNNLIKYTYTPDQRDPSQPDVHEWNQPLLKLIEYADYTSQNQTKFLVSVTFDYEDEKRLDSFSDYRAGFEIRTTKRCKAITIQTHTDQVRSVRTYSLTYETDPHNGVSLLRQINVGGYDDQNNLIEELPPLEFGYTRFEPKQRKFFPVTGADLPPFSLAHRDYEQVGLFGNGLPDILQMNGTVRYWRNLGHGAFDLPREMPDAPAGLGLADSGVQLVDADGDGRTDLLVTTETFSGYFPLRFGGLWDRRSAKRYSAIPSFNLKDPEVKLVDLDGDGLTDVIRSGSRLECFFNDADPRKAWQRTRWVERQQLEVFPNVNFSDPRVKWADMTGDGLQDIVLVYDGNIEYWPDLGHGNWGKRIHMTNSPHFPYGYDPKRILIGDVDGDGLADIVYVDHCQVILWINQSGNGWSQQPPIHGTPPVTDMDAVRLADLLGTGVSGLLWSADANGQRPHMFFLDFTGGVKPYVLSQMDNHMGAVTKVKYESSTHFYLEDQKRRETRWQTPLPFPVQVVSRVEVIDQISRGKLTTEYCYHHGYWDGAEREFRGFGMVEQFDTETFEDYKLAGLHGETTSFAAVEQVHFSPPTRTKTWFHQGPVGEEFGEWQELDRSGEYWSGDPPVLEHAETVNDFLKDLPRRRVKRDALRTLRGSILRTELYALDGSDREDRAYTVTEHSYGLHEESPPAAGDDERLHIFFPHLLAQRTTQWERGHDPATQFTFTDYLDESGNFDAFGRPRRQTQIACPRGWRALNDTPSESYLASRTITDYAAPTGANAPYIHDRVARTTTYEIVNSGGQTVFVLKGLPDDSMDLNVFGQTLNYYDDDAFVGLTFKQIGKYGALVRTESLVLTGDILQKAYEAEQPPYLAAGGAVAWTPDYPQGFKNALPLWAGYLYQPAGPDHVAGYFVTTERRRYDFHDNPVGARGLIKTKRDPLGHDTTIEAYEFDLLPTRVKDAVGLDTTTTYDRRQLQPSLVTDPNGNQTLFTFKPLGLLDSIWVKGKLAAEGDQQRSSVKMEYDFLAFDRDGQPICVRTIRQVHHDTETGLPPSELNEIIEAREYSDGFGRLLQTRTQAEEIVFRGKHVVPDYEDLIFGNDVLPVQQSDAGGDVVGHSVIDPVNRPRVVVSGWQVYDNKGRVVEKYEPFFSEGWDYVSPTDDEFGQKVTMFYDPSGQVIRTLNPGGSEQRVIHGVPGTIALPNLGKLGRDEFEPTPWEAYTYDANDLAPLSQSPQGASLANAAPISHHFTPASIEIDALGRIVKATERNGPTPSTDWYTTRSTYDIQGNLLTVTDALGREAFKHVYDLAKHPLRIESIDAGIRQTVLDAAGNVIEGRNSKGALVLHAHDILNRPTRLWARDGTGQTLTLRGQLKYGDGGTPNQSSAQRTTNRGKNRLGQLSRQYDEAGLLTFVAYDFKGNLLEKRREVIADSAIKTALNSATGPTKRFVVDWNAPPALEGNYQTSTTYDALNRIKSMQYPKDVDGNRQMLTPAYNHAGALESVKLAGEIYVERIAYNAKGQRTLIAYGNHLMTRYAYDSQTFRLVRMRTEKFTTQPTLQTIQPDGGLLQDFAYEYDLAGNILRITDVIPGCGLRNNPEAPLFPELKAQISAGDALVRRFEYDPLYRLISATGRESQNIPNPRPRRDRPRKGFDWGAPGMPSPENARDLTQIYTETYTYDPAGNMLSLSHSGGWTRHFGMAGFTPKQWQDKVADFLAGGLPAWGTGGNRLTNVGAEDQAQTHRFDPNGNLTREHTTRHFVWNYADRMMAFSCQPCEASHTSAEACYLYDADGMRVKKWVRTNGTGNGESTVYIDGVFEHYRWKEIGQPEKQNNHLHVMDNQSRIALVRIGDKHSDDTGPKVQYHLGDHLGSSNVAIGGADGKANGFINREECFPYGETSFGSFGRKRYRFIGKERDEESGLYYHGARYYAPWLLRWISPDPAGMIDGVNLYIAYRNNPLRYVDPGGLQTADVGQGSKLDSDINGTPAGGFADVPTPNTVSVQCESGGFADVPAPNTVSVQCESCQLLDQQSLTPTPAATKWDTLTANEFMNMTPREQRTVIAESLNEGFASRTTVTYHPTIPGPLGIEVSRPLDLRSVEYHETMQANFTILTELLKQRASIGATGTTNPFGTSEQVSQSGSRGSIYKPGHNPEANHQLWVKHLDKEGNIISEWVEGSGGMLSKYWASKSFPLKTYLTHTEVKALSRVSSSLREGDTLLFYGLKSVCPYGICNSMMHTTALGSKVDIYYFRLTESELTLENIYLGGIGRAH